MILVLYLRPIEESADDQAVRKAARLLQAGGVVAFPTETVYGLGACFNQPKAVRKIFLAKGRPLDNPLIAHIAMKQQLSLLVREWPPLAERLTDAFWPGPLTIVVPGLTGLPEEVTAGLDTIAVRMPNHKLALALISATDCPLVAPSANRSGRPSPTTAAHVCKDLGKSIDALLDGGDATLGLESTVVGVSAHRIVIYRPGAVTEEMLRRIDSSVEIVYQANSTETPASPGMKYAHYAPDAKVYLMMANATARTPELVENLSRSGEAVGVLAFDDTLLNIPADIVRLSLGPRNDLSFAARVLYGQMRLADQAGLTILLVEAVEEAGVGRALMNRLQKAAHKVLEE